MKIRGKLIYYLRNKDHTEATIEITQEELFKQFQSQCTKENIAFKEEAGTCDVGGNRGFL